MTGWDAVVRAVRPISLAKEAQQLDPGLKITGIQRMSVEGNIEYGRQPIAGNPICRVSVRRVGRPRSSGVSGSQSQRGSDMTRHGLGLIAVATIIAPLAATPAMAQAPSSSTANPCPPGTVLMPPSRDGAGNPVAAYCAAAPTQGTNDPYTGRMYAPDPQGTPTGGGAGQVIPPTR